MPILTLTIPTGLLDHTDVSRAARTAVAAALDLPVRSVATAVSAAHWTPAEGVVAIVHGRDRGPEATRATTEALRNSLERHLDVDPDLIHIAWPPTRRDVPLPEP